VGASVLVIADRSEELAAQTARSFGREVYRIRKQIGFEGISLGMDAALSRALANGLRPIVVADQSDNVGGGAPGDATFVLRWLLEHGVEDAATAIMYDPEVVKIAKNVGTGARIPIRLGGKLGVLSGQPVDTEAVVTAIRERYMHPFPQETGSAWYFPIGDAAALNIRGIDVIVSSERCQCFSPSIFSDFGVDPRSKKLLIPKSYQHFYGGFAPIAAEVIYMAGPGAIQPDPRELRYSNLDTDLRYPWVEDPMGEDAR